MPQYALPLVWGQPPERGRRLPRQSKENRAPGMRRIFRQEKGYSSRTWFIIQDMMPNSS